MKRVKLTAADIEKLKASPPSTPPDFHHEELQVDALSIGLVRPSASDDPRTNTYSIEFRCGESQYVVVVRPTIHQVPSITLNIISKDNFASYTIVRDTVMTLNGQISGRPAEGAVANFDLGALLEHLKVQ